MKFDYNVEHLNETDKKLIVETNNTDEPKKKKFKVRRSMIVKNFSNT